MVGFKNRYMVMEVFLDPNKEFPVDDPIIISPRNLTSAIEESIRFNFGECGSASSTNSFLVKYVNPITKVCIFRASRDDYQKVWSAITMVQIIGNCPVVFNLLSLSGNIKACRTAVLKCEEQKFEMYKSVAGTRLTDYDHQQMLNYLQKIKALEH